MSRPVIVWTPERDALLGTMSDANLGKMLGGKDHVVRKRRLKLGVTAFRIHLAPLMMKCSNCGEPTKKNQKDIRKHKDHYCDKDCANAGQKRRDSEMLRYGPGWKKQKAKARLQYPVCQSCGKTPEENKGLLHIHHLKPYRFGGTNRMENLTALCDSCHHKIEALTSSVLVSIPIEVTLVRSYLTITLSENVLWHGSVVGVDSLTPNGSTLSPDSVAL